MDDDYGLLDLYSEYILEDDFINDEELLNT